MSGYDPERIVPLRGTSTDKRPVDFKRQKRKKQAKSKRSQISIAAADFETIDGDAWIFSMAWFTGEARKPKMMKSALDEYTDDSPFTFRRFIDFIFDNAGILWRRGGKNAVKGVRAPYLFYYNLSYDASTLIKQLKPSSIDKLMMMEKIVIDAETTQPVEIKRDKWGNPNLTKAQRKLYLLQMSYLPKKHLSLKPLGALTEHTDSLGTERVRGAIDMFDIAQFYGKSLKAASEEAMKAGRIEQMKLDTIDTKRMNDAQYRADNYDEILRYALVDAEVTLALSWFKVHEFENQGFRMTNPYSLASISERSLLDLCEIPILDPHMKHHNERVLSFWTAFQGGWFECTGSGFREGVTAWDLASAYPYIMWHLPNFDEGYWGKGRHDREWEFWRWIDERKPFTLGCAECVVIFPPNLPIYPAAKMSGAGCVVNPRRIKGWFVADELDEFRKWGAEITVDRWFCHYPDYTSENVYPFRPFLEPAYKAKYEQGLLKDTPAFDKALYDCSKVRLNSCFGKTVQSISAKEPSINEMLSNSFDALDFIVMNQDEVASISGKPERTGNIWNPYWGATITGATRARMAQFVRLNGAERVVGVATDGIIMQGDEIILPPRPSPAIYNLGEWEPDGEGDCLIMMSGVYSIRRKGEKAKSTFRGAASLFIGADGQPLSWFDFCSENASEPFISRDHENHPHSRPYSIAEARIRGDYSLINVFRVVRASIKALGDSNKRQWAADKPQTFSDLQDRWFTSEPHDTLL